jgi:hypothetical protein
VNREEAVSLAQDGVKALGAAAMYVGQTDPSLGAALQSSTIAIGAVAAAVAVWWSYLTPPAASSKPVNIPRGPL